ncbi:MAG: hypothetical protein LKJ22_08480 [Liquorilactobacillus nagelii]|jgi:hypothetical protein|uniref:hypothetical protein n=1 Tax=Liquorilactobacillus nagelii TaxID=82688 RepID=UPI00242F7977|nr:hypothetical protein [Liquorilactobacillus nagelii]MCI1921942.1 hypothetical protein [Liquorilactobacillus nagelii]MCI1976410.1 hypothetical protein [Liquorilactobacillus nagelii]
MIGFLWFHTLFFPAIVFIGGLVAILWLVGKVASAVERFSTRVARSWHSANSERGNNSN